MKCVKAIVDIYALTRGNHGFSHKYHGATNCDFMQNSDFRITDGGGP
jgi:hypothetical protein